MLLLRCFVLFAFVLAGCASPGVEVPPEWRWSSELEWHAKPSPRPAGDTVQIARFAVPSDLDGDAAVVLKIPMDLESASADGVSLAFAGHWPILRLPPGARSLELRYHAFYTLKSTTVHFGRLRELTQATLRQEVPVFGGAAALIVLGFVAATAGMVRRARAVGYFGLFSLCLGAMKLAQLPLLYALLFGSGGSLYVVHTIAIFGIPVSLSMFFVEVFGGRFSRALRSISLFGVGLCLLSVALHAAKLVPLFRFRLLADVVILVGAALVLATTIPLARKKRDRKAIVLLIGFAILLVAGVPEMLAGLGRSVPEIAEVGALAFVGCLAQILGWQYAESHAKLEGTSRALERRVIELDQKNREVETLNTELRHQVVERSRELQRSLSSDPGSDQVEPRGFPRVGDRIAGRYQVVAQLGSGAMGAVFEVERASDRVRLALKVMLHVQGGAEVARFAREAEIAASVSHPNLVGVVDVGVGSWGTPFLVMELIRGNSLEEESANFGNLGFVLPILRDIAEALAALHNKGVVHRDLKPSNILVSRDDKSTTVKLADFGISRWSNSAAPLDDTLKKSDAKVTKTGAFLGTPLYMAPEQAKHAESVGVEADAFSFGVLAFELLTGSLPFSTPPVFFALAGAPIPAPGRSFASIPGLSPRLADALQKCLSASPTMRPKLNALAAEFAS